MKNEIKILKFIRNNDNLKAEKICNNLNIDYEKSMHVIRHLMNQGFISLIRKQGRVGTLRDSIDPLGITTNGIKHLERRIPEIIRFYAPLGISATAVVISIIALFNSM